jgi:protein ImuB
MAIWLPRLSTDRLIRAAKLKSDRPARAEAALTVYAKQAHAFVLTAVNACAARAGLAPGQSLADARAIAPDLLAIEADAAADARALDSIAAWCGRYTPIIAPDAPDGLTLDITGAAHLFGGDAAVLEDAEARLKAQGFSARAAIAPNPAAAWACARYGQTRIVDELEQALAPLPVAALRLEPAAAALLKRLGLKSIGQLIAAPRQPFTARAGARAMNRLDQALGRAREALTPRRPAPPLYVLHRFAEPLVHLDALLIAVETACASLCAQLDARGHGLRRAQLYLFALDGKTRAFEIGLSRPERDARVLLRLLRERLGQNPETIDAEFGIEALRLDACDIAPIVLHATDLAPASRRDTDSEARCLDALRVRLGDARVGRLSIRNAHAPERANGWAHASLRQAQGIACLSLSKTGDNVMRRPLRLFAPAQPIEAMAAVPDGPPLRFRWRRVLREVARAEGPERIAPDWLRAPDTSTRDYYRVEDNEGRRYWLYRQGFYGAEAPRWFLHGLFA